jgi:glycosyltransferase involved in cell wall biosynthesis
MTDERPLTILHLVAGSDPGGISRYLVDLCGATHQLGHRVAIAGQRGERHDWFEGTPWDWVEVPLKGGWRGLRRSAQILGAYVAEHRPDVLHVHGRRAALVARRMQLGGRPPLLFTLHLSHIPLWGPYRWFSDFGDCTHVASEMAKRWVVERAGVDEGRVRLVPHGVDVKRFAVADEAAKRAAKKAMGLPAEALVAAYVGRLEKPKNEGWVLDVAKCASLREDVRVVLAGDGPNEQALRRRIAREGLGDRVVMLGHCDPLGVYQAADALLLPSQREGFSLACAEAMSVGVPVLRTRTAGASELIVEGVTGRSVTIEHDAFVSAAAEFLRDREALRDMGRTAARHVREHFPLERQVAETIRMYQSLMESGEQRLAGAERC